MEQTQNLFITHTNDGRTLPSWIIERIGESLVVVTYIEYLGERGCSWKKVAFPDLSLQTSELVLSWALVL
jgi:hypothetical protein